MSSFILASSSSSRAEMLEKLGIVFTCQSPDIDETPHEGEDPHALVTRLSISKGQKVAASHPDAIIISGDQVLAARGQIFGKPKTHENALAQLMFCRGYAATFFTGIAVHHQNKQYADVVTTQLSFRRYDENEAKWYLQQDEPYHCAGSLRFEGAAHWLLHACVSQDHSAITGLPLIALQQLLTKLGHENIHEAV